MSCSFRGLLVLLAALATTADVQAGSKAPPRRPPAPHRVHRPPIHVPHIRVTHHPRPAVHRIAVHRVRHAPNRIVRQPVRRTAIRTIHRYPVHRVQRRFVRRPYYSGRHFGVRRYTYSYYPRRYAWRTNHYNRGYGVRRRHPRAIGGIVEAVQGNALNGMLLVKVIRSRSSRFRYARVHAGGWGATSLHRFHLNGGTSYAIMTIPPRVGTIADLHKGERVLVLTPAKSANIALRVQASPRRRR